MSNADKINRILHDVIIADAGIQRVILADKTGLTIAHTSRFAFDDEVDIDGLGAIASAVYLASEQQGANVDLSTLQVILSEFNDGKVLVASCGSSVLCLITEANIQIGMVRQTMKRAAGVVREILDAQIVAEPAYATPSAYPPAETLAEASDPIEEDDFVSDLELALRELEQF